MILIIRHKSEDREFQKKLDKNNLNYFYQPVLKFNYIKKKIINSYNKIFIIASIQAVKSLELQNKEHLNQIKDSRLFVIGKKVKEALVKLGINRIIKTFDSTTSLIKFIHKKNSYKKIKFEYLCGSVVNDEFVNKMKNQKYSLRKKVVYQVTPLDQLLEKTKVEIKSRRIKVIIFYSVFSAKFFLRLLKKNDLMLFINEDMKFLSFSERISKHIYKEKVLTNQNISSIGNPNSLLLLRSVKRILNTR